MAALPATSLRELDHRRNHGIDVTLLWDPQTDRVSLALTDEHSGESLTVEVAPAEALTAFHHPFAYAHDSGPVMSGRPSSIERDEAMNPIHPQPDPPENREESNVRDTH